MSLQFVIGSAGTGKSHYVYERLIREARENPEKMYYVVVPEQFTLQTQKNLVEMSPAKGILNIDILSFERLAYRVFEETGGDDRILLNDTGKTMILQKMVQKYKKELPYLGGQMEKPGYLEEVKSLISEFLQYGIGEQELSEMLKDAEEKTILHMKLKDVETLYKGLREYMEGHYMTGEEVMDVLLRMLPFSKKLKNSVMVFDGFTGFTPVQVEVIRELLCISERMIVTVTMDAGENPYTKGTPYQLFYMGKKLVQTLSRLTRDIEEPVLLAHGENSRFFKAPALQFLEENIFRFKKDTFLQEQDSISIFYGETPKKELEEAVRRAVRLARTKGIRYGEMAIVTGNLEEYGVVARQVLEAAEVPYFLDEKHTILMNPFIEYLRAAIEMTIQGFSYESVFRYLRCGMSNLTREETDVLENYVIALGIRGISRWKEEWVRLYKGMTPGESLKINELRNKFLEEIQPLADGFSKEKKTVEEYSRILYDFITATDCWKKIKEREQEFHKAGNLSMEKEYSQIYGIVMELLDSMVDILGKETVSRQEFSQILDSGLGEAKVALIPPAQDQILVGDIERTRLKSLKALFFVGVNDGSIPKNTESGGILTEFDREFFEEKGVELAPGSKEKMGIQKYYLYLNLTKPEKYLCLSYSLSNHRGEAKTPAYLIETIKNLFLRLEAEPGENWESPADILEFPQTGLPYFIRGLSLPDTWNKDGLFEELYSWYLKNGEYAPLVKKLVEAAHTRKPVDQISAAVAKALYGTISPYSATRLERFSACAFAHYLQYGLRLSERVQYEFHPADMGSIMHIALENFAVEIRNRGLEWRKLTESMQEEIIDKCLDDLVVYYGNTILKSSARNEAMVERIRRILHRTVWALQTQIKNGLFEPEGFEVKFEGGRIDRVDVLEEEDKVYIKVIDYKTGNTKFDLLCLYHGLQLQLMIYFDGALQVEQKKYPDKEILPAGVFYYNVKDPMIKENIKTDIESVNQKILKSLKMNGIACFDENYGDEMFRKMDKTLVSLPVSANGSKISLARSSVMGQEKFARLNRYVKRKTESLCNTIMEGEAEISPYRLGAQNACTYCPYVSVCGFDSKVPGFEFRNLKAFDDKEIWEEIEKEENGNGNEMDGGAEESNFSS